MELFSTGTAAFKWLGSYFLTHNLNRIFTSEDNFTTELMAVINQAINEYASKYPESDKNGKFSFYKSRKLIEELLKFRIMSDKNYNLDDLKDALTAEECIIPPTIEQVNEFYKIFSQHIQANNKLKELEINELSRDEIFRIKQILKDLTEHINNLVSTYNGDLQAQWKNRLNTYIETLKEFKPQTALGLLHSLEASFNGSKNKPDPELIALIKYQEAICLNLLGDDKCYISFIDAYKKDNNNIKYKEKAAFAYYQIKVFEKTKVLIDELLTMDDYNITAWAIKLLLSSESDNIASQIPVYVKNNIQFQCLLFNHYVSSDNLTKFYQLQNESIIQTSKHIFPIKIDIDSFHIGIFSIYLMINEYLKEYNYIHFTDNTLITNELIKIIKNQSHNITEKIKDSEIKDKYSTVFICYALANYILTKDKQNLLIMMNYIIKDKSQSIYLIIICANLLQLEEYNNEAIDLLNTSPTVSFESGSLKSFIFLKQNKLDAYIASITETYNSTLNVDERIVYAYLNSIFLLKEFNVIDKINIAVILENKIYYSNEAKELCEIIAKTLSNTPDRDYEQKLSNLSDHFSEDNNMMLLIAELYYYGGSYSNAKDIYNRYLDKEHESIYLFRYINCLYKLKTETLEALSLLLLWRENYSFNPDLTRIEYNLSVSLLDWQRCLDIINYGLKHDPSFEDFTDFKLLILDKLGVEDINSDIEAYLIIKNKNIQYLPEITNIFIKNGRSEDALILLEKNYSDDNLEIQMSYIRATIAYSQEHEYKQGNLMIEYDVANWGNFVKYELNGRTKFIELKEISNQSMLISTLIGKHKNDIVPLKRQMTSKTDEIKIVRIMDKYLYLHDLIFDKANDPHSGLPMEVINYNPSDDTSIIDIFKEQFGEKGDAREKYISNILEQYYSRQISYSEVILNACAKDYIAGYFHLIFTHKGILTIPKIIYENHKIYYDKPYIIDLSTLPLLFRLSDSHNVQYPNKFIISKHLVELIRNKLKELKTNPHFSMSIITTSTQVTRVDYTEDKHLNNIKYLSNLLDWVKCNCEEKVSHRTSEFSRRLAEDNNNYSRFFVNYILNTMLLREDLDATLITDDTIYNQKLQLPLANTMSAEVFVESIVPINSPALIEFVYLKYLGFDYPSSLWIDEFEKKRKDEPNEYAYMVDNYAPTSWRSLIDLILHITSTCTEDNIAELKLLENTFLQYCSDEHIVKKMRSGLANFYWTKS